MIGMVWSCTISVLIISGTSQDPIGTHSARRFREEDPELTSSSPHMFPKQVEMDGIIKSIYHTLEGNSHMESTLLVVCGDHGMNEAGNHGGSSEGETSPALLFISPKMRSISRGLECPMSAANGTFEYYEKVEQSDIAPTLAALLGFPIPKNNLGVAIPSLLLLLNSGMFASSHRTSAL